MSLKQIQATGINAVNMASALLNRVRLADPVAGLWEAGDVQWWWGVPRASDQIEQVFWLDDEGPVAGVYVTAWRNDQWQVDPIIVAGCTSISPNAVWQTARQLGEQFAPNGYDVPIGDDDETFQMFARESGFVAGDSDWTSWMSATDVPGIAPLADGFTIVDRSQSTNRSHPIATRNGADLESRLAQVNLYDPTLDLSIVAPDGRSAAYILFWFDPVTRVGLIEPVRTEDDFQRLGLARALITAGMARLVEKGAERLKVSWETEPAGALYQKVGFQVQSTTTFYQSGERD